MLSIFSFSTPCYPTFAMRQAINMYHVIETLSSTFYQRYDDIHYTLDGHRPYHMLNALYVAITMRIMLHSEQGGHTGIRPYGRVAEFVRTEGWGGASLTI